MNRPTLLAALALCCALPAAGLAGDGDLTPPPAAKGHQAPITVGFECPRMRLDPCKNVTGGTPVCEDGEWVCENGCKGGPPPCVFGKSGQCVNRQWQCVDTNGSCTGDQPECGAGKTAQCVAGAWKCQFACDGAPPSCGPGLVPKCMGGFGGGWQCWTSGDGGNGCKGDPPACLAPGVNNPIYGRTGTATCQGGQWVCPGASDSGNDNSGTPVIGGGPNSQGGQPSIGNTR